MLIVGGIFEIEPDQRDAFLAGRLELMRGSRAEAGCLDYTFSADPMEPSRVLLFERWESQEALDAHLAGLRTAPPPSGTGVTPTSASITIYDIAAQRPLGG